MTEPPVVVSAVIIRSGRILLTQRLPNKDFPRMWECPGGKVEERETFRQALMRELEEEIGITREDLACAVAEDMVWRGLVNVGRTGPKRICFYLVELKAMSEPRPLEGQGIGWFTLAEMGALELVPGNKLAFHRIALSLAYDAANYAVPIADEAPQSALR